jgi:sec-independent protein translocase protein TatC
MNLTERHRQQAVPRGHWRHVCFQTPLVMLFLSIIGVFTAADYRAKHRLAVLVILISAMILTPGPDASRMLFLSIPVLLLP